MSFSDGLTAGSNFIDSIYAARQTALDNARKNAAATDAIKQDGPQAGDPDNWLKNIAAQAATAQLPYVAPTAAANVQKTQLENTGTQNDQQRMGQYRAVAMMQDYIDPKTGSVDPQAFDRIVGDGSLLGIDPQHMAPLRALVTAPGGGAHLSSFAQALIGPAKIAGASTVTKNADGSYSVAREDQYGQMHVTPMGAGVTPVLAANGEARVGIAQGNLDERTKQDAYLQKIGWTKAGIAAFRASTMANNSAYGAGDGQTLPSTAPPGQAPPQGGAAPQAPAPPQAPPGNVPSAAGLDAFITKYGGNIDAAIAATGNNSALTNAVSDRYEQVHHLGQYAQPGPPGTSPAPAVAPSPAAPVSPLDRFPPKGQAMARDQARQVVNANTMFDNTKSIMDQADKQISPYTTGVGSLMAHMPGSVQTDLLHNLNTIKANVGQAVLTSMKGTNGSTGIGRVLQAEYNNFVNVLGAVDPKQSAAAVRYHLGLVRASLTKMNAALNDGYQAQWKTDPYSAIGEKPPGASPSASKSDAALLAKYGVH